jgi:uncharacterized membrane protein
MSALPAEAAERRKRVTHRLEAFSDIVIGFSLAQLTLSLVIPTHVIDFVQRPLGIIAFLVTFVLVVRFWWLHFVIFEHYFEPTRLTVTCNFIALASLILQIFSLQLYVHFVPTLSEGIVASRLYFGFFVLSYGMLCVMLAVGLHQRWAALTVGRRRAGVRAALRIAGTVAGCTVGDLLSTHVMPQAYVLVNSRGDVVATFPLAILFFTLGGTLVGFVLGRLPATFRGLRTS